MILEALREREQVDDFIALEVREVHEALHGASPASAPGAHSDRSSFPHAALGSGPDRSGAAHGGTPDDASARRAGTVRGCARAAR